jgi:hypothetical protein
MFWKAILPFDLISEVEQANWSRRKSGFQLNSGIHNSFFVIVFANGIVNSSGLEPV